MTHADVRGLVRPSAPRAGQKRLATANAPTPLERRPARAIRCWADRAAILVALPDGRRSTTLPKSRPHSHVERPPPPRNAGGTRRDAPRLPFPTRRGVATSIRSWGADRRRDKPPRAASLAAD